MRWRYVATAFGEVARAAWPASGRDRGADQRRGFRARAGEGAGARCGARGWSRSCGRRGRGWDGGDRERFRWRPDRGEPRGRRTWARIVEIVQDTARRVAEAARRRRAHARARRRLHGRHRDGHRPRRARRPRRPRLLRHPRGPERPVQRPRGRVGLDGHRAHAWRGRHRPGSPEAGPIAPLLAAAQVVLFGWGPDQATQLEREAVERLAIAVAGGRGPRRPAPRPRPRARSPCWKTAVTAWSSTSTSTSSTSPTRRSRRTGVATRASPSTPPCARFAAVRVAPARPVTVTELNPDHVEAGAGTLERFCDALAGSLVAPPPSG